MIRLAPIVFVIAMLCAPAWARAPQTYAEQEQYCAYGAGGALVSVSDAGEPCDVPRDNSLLFWSLVIAGGVLVLIGQKLTRVRP